MAEPQDMAWKDIYRYLEEEVPDEQVGPVGRVVGDGEPRVLAGGTGVMVMVAMMVNAKVIVIQEHDDLDDHTDLREAPEFLPPLELDFIKELLQRR